MNASPAAGRFPRDFWGFTPDGLRWLHRDRGSIVACDGQGTFEARRVIRDVPVSARPCSLIRVRTRTARA